MYESMKAARARTGLTYYSGIVLVRGASGFCPYSDSLVSQSQTVLQVPSNKSILRIAIWQKNIYVTAISIIGLLVQLVLVIHGSFHAVIIYRD
jgi:hypothetical protein